MPTYKLHYFDLYGRGEITRLIFAASGTEYEDVRIKQEDWPALKEKSPTGHLPYLEIDGKVLSQSFAIARYIAKVTGMAGKNDFEQAQVDEVVDHWFDLQFEMAKAHFEADATKKEEMIKKLKEETCPKKMMFMEGLLKRNNGGDGFFIGKALTWADLATINVVGFLMGRAEEEVKKCTKLLAHYNRITGLPKIAEYLKNRPKRDL